MHNEVRFKLGGISHTLRVPLNMAQTIENELGMGLLKLARLLAEQELTTTQVADVLRVAFYVNGKEYDNEQLLAMMSGHEGYIFGFGAALSVVKELFNKPKDPNGKKATPGNGRATNDQVNSSH